MPAPRRLLLVLVALALVVASAACGGDDDGDDEAVGSDEIDPCALVTKAEVEDVVGEAFEEPERSTAPAPFEYRACSWTAVEAPPVKVVTVQVLTDDDIARNVREAGQRTVTLFDATRSAAEQEGAEVVELDSVGDEAYRIGPRVLVLHGGTLLEVTTVSGTSEKATAALEEIAGIAAERL